MSICLEELPSISPKILPTTEGGWKGKQRRQSWVGFSGSTHGKAEAANARRLRARLRATDHHRPR